MAVLAAGLYVLLEPVANLNPALSGFHLRGHTLALPNPGERGPLTVTSFTYGSGKDARRPEYGKLARLITRSVDGSKIYPLWSGLRGALRTRYWGFDAAHMPLQGQVWLPRGAGPFPLVLIVHGNHAMGKPSEAGYAYLGEHLASQGFILVSVDENFLNSGVADALSDPRESTDAKEIPARAWLLLEHLKQWRDWAADAGSPVYGRVDMDRIALIGHSRGGEAVVLANQFNDLDAFPDDAAVPFDFHFHLRAIAAIAPCECTDKLHSARVKLRDQNYFVMAGSRDGDNGTSFRGEAQYSRVNFSGAVDAFKASIYIKDANHGQFNSVWGRNDSGGAYGFATQQRQILAGSAQRQIATVYLTAFLDVTLKAQTGYHALFEDPRNGAGWLPDDFIVSNYADGRTRWLVNYEEDADPATGSDPNVRIEGADLSIWREGDPDLKLSKLGSRVAIVGWDDRTDPAHNASYRIAFRDPARVSPDTDLVFGASQIEIVSEDRTAVDWTIILTDASGQTAHLPLSHDQLLYPQVIGATHRAGMIDEQHSELVMRRYRYGLRDFLAVNPSLDLERLVEIRFAFDRSARGTIALDDVGFAPRS